MERSVRLRSTVPDAATVTPFCRASELVADRAVAELWREWASRAFGFH
jgi:hypothetical protein